MEKAGSSSSPLDDLFEIEPELQAYNQKNDIFNRAMWDESIDPKDFFVSYDITNYKPKKAKGFNHWDFALRNASWHLTDVVGEMKLESEGRVEGFTDYYSIQTPGPPERANLPETKLTTQRIKQVAKFLGAGSVGVCAIDRRWVYSHQFNRKSGEAQELDFPAELQYAIVLILPMDYQLGKTFPSALSGATTGMGYATSLNCANMLAQFITNLGYEAIASLNDTALSIPMAIEAGLGEYGRHGLLITPEFGPNVRIAKVFTDLPLEVDQFKEFGVKAFCEICRKCAKACPPRAISKEAPSSTPPNFSSFSGIKKWTVNAEKCFKFWVKMNTDCAICIRVCPYNKDYSKWWNRLGIKLASSPLRRIMLWLDNKLGFGKRMKPADWWENKSGSA
ncbi:MAG: reductive dehalogenase [Saprospiraceae bacterium]|nr:reductive dehalogenase [Saprospiraceae bacterium]